MSRERHSPDNQPPIKVDVTMTENGHGTGDAVAFQVTLYGVIVARNDDDWTFTVKDEDGHVWYVPQGKVRSYGDTRPAPPFPEWVDVSYTQHSNIRRRIV